MPRFMFALTLGAAIAAFGSPPSPVLADEAQVARGRYLVTIAGCSDCHTPGALIGAPDMKRYLAGSDIGFSIPGLGVFVGQNLTPDKETGIGSWTSESRSSPRSAPARSRTAASSAASCPIRLSRTSATRTRRR